MTNEQKKPSNQQRRIWWEELLGIYRDERIDAINRVASRRFSIVLAVALLGTSIYQLVQGDAWGWLVLALVLLTAGYMVWQRRRFAPGPLDEWSDYQFNRQYLYVGSMLILVPIAFWLLPVATAVDSSVWALWVSVPIMVSLGTQLTRRTYPLRTWLLALVMLIGGGVFGFFSATGDIPTPVIWFVGIVYAIVLVAVTIYWQRSGKW